MSLFGLCIFASLFVHLCKCHLFTFAFLVCQLFLNIWVHSEFYTSLCKSLACHMQCNLILRKQCMKKHFGACILTAGQTPTCQLQHHFIKRLLSIYLCPTPQSVSQLQQKHQVCIINVATSRKGMECHFIHTISHTNQCYADSLFSLDTTKNVKCELRTGKVIPSGDNPLS